MRVEVNAIESGTEARVSVLHQPALMMALRTGAIEVGLRRSEMMRSTFGAGEMCLVPRHVETWLRTDDLHYLYLSVDISDAALAAACDGTRGDVELRRVGKLVNARVGALAVAVNAERVAGYSGLHRRIGRILVCHIQERSTDLVAVLFHNIVEPTGIAGCCHEASAGCEDCFGDVAAQTACASRYQPNFGHNRPPLFKICRKAVIKSLESFHAEDEFGSLDRGCQVRCPATSSATSWSCRLSMSIHWAIDRLSARNRRHRSRLGQRPGGLLEVDCARRRP
jgi:hypothetical protein